jgi:arylsulfatase A-like enzyme
MNVVLIVCDSLRRDHLGCYDGIADTPHLDKLAEQAVVFDQSYTASFPTGPNRQDLHTGRFTFPYQRWDAPLPDDPRLATSLAANGVNTMMVSDTPALMRPEYPEGFRHVNRLRHWSEPLPPGLPGIETSIPAAPEKLRRPERVLDYVAKNAARKSEADYYCARTMSGAAKFLEQHAHEGPFFLYADTFDPHEPWFPPPWYLDRYDPGYDGEMVLEPAYEPEGYCTEREVQHMRARYASVVTMVDAWVGHLLWAIDRLNLADDTAVIVTTDHGFYHANHGLVGKVRLDTDDRVIGRYPLHYELTRTPLLIRVPGVDARRIDAFVQPPDIMPTIMELYGLPIPERVQGSSMGELMRGETDKLRDWAISSHTMIQDDECRSPATLYTDRWAYLFGGDEVEHRLYDRLSDPEELSDITSENPDALSEAHEMYNDVLRQIESPAERVDGRKSSDPRPGARGIMPKFI